MQENQIAKNLNIDLKCLAFIRFLVINSCLFVIADLFIYSLLQKNVFHQIKSVFAIIVAIILSKFNKIIDNLTLT
jgi:hypothetical protein